MAWIKPQALSQQSKRKKGPSRIDITTILICTLIVVVMEFFLYTCHRHWSWRPQFHMENASFGVEHDNMFGDLQKAVAIPKYAVMNTSKGSITVELYNEGSPQVVAEFIDSSNKGRFKGSLFYRVIKNFVIQAGDVDRPGTTENWTSRGKHYNQLDTSLKHEAFMLGTSKAKQDGSGFHLFITTTPIADLNEKISVFGRVVKGEEVVQCRPQFHMENASFGVEHDNMFGDLQKAVAIPKYAVMNTSKGSITVELYNEGSPQVVAEFIDSSNKGRFKGSLFYRVIKNFVIQAGDVDRPGTTENWTSRGKHYNQLDTSLKHEAFMLGTSKAKQDGSGFHLFITTTPIADLNEKISVFGRVVKGEEVVQEIEEVDLHEHYQPKTPIEIIEVTLKQKI